MAYFTTKLQLESNVRSKQVVVDTKCRGVEVIESQTQKVEHINVLGAA